MTKDTFITKFVNYFKTRKSGYPDEVKSDLEKYVQEEASKIFDNMSDFFNSELNRVIEESVDEAILKYMSKERWVSTFTRLVAERNYVLDERDRWSKRYDKVTKSIEELNASEFWRNTYIRDMCGCRGYIRNISCPCNGKIRVLIWDNNDPKLDAWKDFEPEDFKKFISQYC